MITKEQEEALQFLESNTHELWNQKKAEELTAPFGFVCRVRKHEADGGPGNPKGLYLDGGVKFAIGAATWEISRQIVDRVGATSRDCLGRGFQVRADCDAIRKHLSKEE